MTRSIAHSNVLPKEALNNLHCIFAQTTKFVLRFDFYPKNYHLSQCPKCKLDFIHKLAIAQKEANESDYWIELLFKSEYLSETQYQSSKLDIVEINKIIASIIITSKERIGKK